MSSGAQRKAPEPDSAAAAAAAASAREKQRARRRRRAAMNDHIAATYEFMDLDPDRGADADLADQAVTSAVASGQGAGALGFAGTVHRDAAEAAGLATLAGDEFGGGPSVPMVPGTWEHDQMGWVRMTGAKRPRTGTFPVRQPTSTCKLIEPPASHGGPYVHPDR